MKEQSDEAKEARLCCLLSQSRSRLSLLASLLKTGAAHDSETLERRLSVESLRRSRWSPLSLLLSKAGKGAGATSAGRSSLSGSCVSPGPLP